MKIQQFKLALIVLCSIVLSASAQRAKVYTQEFKVKPDVVIDVNTRYTDIEIETWNKNEVVIEAYMEVKGEDVNEETRKELSEKWDVEAMGNSDKVHVKSRSNNYFDIQGFNFDDIDYEHIFPNDFGEGSKNFQFVFPEVSIASLDILDSMDFVMPELPPMPDLPEIVLPELPPLPPMPPMPTEFDFDAYKKDKSYLERWKKENEDIFGEDAKVTVNGNAIKVKSDSKDGSFNWNFSTDHEKKVEELQESLKRANELQKRAYEKRKEAYEKNREAYKSRRKELEQRTKERVELIKKRNKERMESRKLALVERQEVMEKRRKEMQQLLKNREKYKVERMIKIKAPKDAKFNMNVKYGSLSFPK